MMIRKHKIHRNANGVSGQVAAIKADMNQFQEDVAAFCRAVVEAGDSGLKDAGAHVSGEVHQRLDNLQQRLQSVRDRGRDAMSSIEDKILEKPLMTIAIAFAVGLFARSLFHRNDT